MSEIMSYLAGIVSGFFLKMVIALIIILVGFIVGRVFGRIIQKVLHEVELNRIIKRSFKIKVSVEEMAGSITSYLIYFVTVILALKEIGVATLVLDFLLGAIIFVVILAFFLSVKDFIPNMVAGISIHQKKSIKKGDVIRVKDCEGAVVYIDLIETRIKTKSGDVLHVPNSIVLKEMVLVKKK